MISRIIFYSVFLFMVTCVAQGQNVPVEPQSEKISEIMNAMKIEEQLHRLPEELRSQFNNNPFGIEPAQNQRLLKLFSQSYHPDSLREDARAIFQARYRPEYVDSTLGWFGTKEMSRLQEAEREYYTLQGVRKRVVRKYEIEQQPPSDERMQIVTKLVESTVSPVTVADYYSIVFRSFIAAFYAMSDQQAASEAQLDMFVQNYRAQLEPEIRRELIQQHLVMYYELENELLSKYSGFYQSDAGNWLATTTAQSVRSAYQSAADRFVESAHTTE